MIGGLGERPSHALEEELIGLSLASGQDDKPISPRTIKRPTNPVATCLERKGSNIWPLGRGITGPVADDSSVAKRPRLDGEMWPWVMGSALAHAHAQQHAGAGGISHQASPPSLSPLISGSTRFASSRSGSSGGSLSSSVLESPVHLARNFDDLAEPRPVAPFGVAFGGGGEDSAIAGAARVVYKCSLDDPMGSEVPRFRGLGAFEAIAGAAEPRGHPPSAECCSPVALATNSMCQSLRLGPPLGHEPAALPPSLAPLPMAAPTAVPARSPRGMPSPALQPMLMPNPALPMLHPSHGAEMQSDDAAMAPAVPQHRAACRAATLFPPPPGLCAAGDASFGASFDATFGPAAAPRAPRPSLAAPPAFAPAFAGWAEGWGWAPHVPSAAAPPSDPMLEGVAAAGAHGGYAPVAHGLGLGVGLGGALLGVEAPAMSTRHAFSR